MVSIIHIMAVLAMLFSQTCLYNLVRNTVTQYAPCFSHVRYVPPTHTPPPATPKGTPPAYIHTITHEQFGIWASFLGEYKAKQVYINCCKPLQKSKTITEIKDHYRNQRPLQKSKHPHPLFLLPIQIRPPPPLYSKVPPIGVSSTCFFFIFYYILRESA